MNPSQDQRPQLYDEHRQRAWQDIQSSSDDFDKYILTLSSGALGLSLSFIKEIVPLGTAVWRSMLYFSWGCFGLCILLTILSYQFGILAQKEHLRNLPKFYIEGDQKALQRGGYWKTVARLTWICCGLFIVGLICTLLFCISNMEGVRMSEWKKVQESRQPIPFTPCAQENTSVPSEGIVQKSRQPIAMTPPVQQTPAQNPGTAPGSQPNTAKPENSQKP